MSVRTGVMTCLLLLATTSVAAENSPSESSYEPIGVTRLVVPVGSGSLVGRSDIAYHDEISDRLRGLGFLVPGGSSLLFDQRPAPKTQLQLGGEVVDGKCIDRHTTGNMWCELAVHWEVFDVQSLRVVYQTTTRAQAEVDGATYRSGRAFGVTLSASVEHLAAKAHFVDALRPSLADAAPVTDPDEPSQLGQYDHENGVIARRRTVGAVGIGVSVVGLFLVRDTWRRYNRHDFIASPDRWRRMQNVNTVGWALGIGGLAVPLLTPVVLPMGGGVQWTGKW